MAILTTVYIYGITDRGVIVNHRLTAINSKILGWGNIERTVQEIHVVVGVTDRRTAFDVLFLLRLDGRKLLLLPVQELIGMLTIMHRMKVLRFRLIWS